ncbi:MAG: glycosyltransferase [Promethearchaeota archaeon]
MGNISTKSALVGIFIPVYNGEKYIEETLKSILNQTYENIKVTVLDDCSTDKTPNIVKAFAKKDPRVIYIRNEKNLGLAGNFLNGMKHHTIGYFYIISQDDIIRPNFLSKIMNVFVKYPEVGAVLTSLYYIDADGRILPRSKYFSREKPSGIITFKDLVKYNINPNPGALVIKNLVGYYDPQYTYCFDLEYFLRLLYNKIKVYYLNDKLLLYRLHKDRATHRYNLLTREKEVFKVYLKYLREHKNYLHKKWVETILYISGDITEFSEYKTLEQQLLFAFILTPTVLFKIYYWKYWLRVCFFRLELLISRLNKIQMLDNLINRIKGIRLGRKIISFLKN